MKPFNKDEKYYRAKKRVIEIKKFYMSVLSYVVFIGLLAGLNYYTNQWRNAWFLWAAFGWGIGLVFQAAKAFDLNPFLGKDWEERKMREFMEKDTEGTYKETKEDNEPTIRF